MKRTFKLGIVAISAFISSASFGQSSVGRPSISIGAEIGVPAGDLNASRKIGVGGTAKAAFPVANDLDLTLQAGYISFSGDETTVGNTTIKGPALNFIPIKAGVRYRFVPGGFYLEPQLGYTSLSTPGESSSTGGFTYAANAGYMFGKNWDVSARYEAVSRKNQNLPFVGFRLGYSFNL
jgi:hypothetical protein